MLFILSEEEVRSVGSTRANRGEKRLKSKAATPSRRRFSTRPAPPKTRKPRARLRHASGLIPLSTKPAATFEPYRPNSSTLPNFGVPPREDAPTRANPAVFDGFRARRKRKQGKRSHLRDSYRTGSNGFLFGEAVWMQDSSIQDASGKIPEIVADNRGLRMNSCILNSLNLASNGARETIPSKPISYQLQKKRGIGLANVGTVW